ncbi:MAG: Glycosyl transferase group 1 [uncultured Thiotrichaceae bacterium]|uniref:Glycosyl transferase group 1 n=1 Tax=uncultured Thiotrichaceae bacterium TaxID=298394 RepID=A0A6S6SIJ3_9GAMM|nr:MAG: Glycosyl transferase group 1 [uncultured Thiotrichaceae bacterium]
MKIAFVIHSLTQGGAERAVSNLSLAMQHEHDVTIILFDTNKISYPYGGKIHDLNVHASSSKAMKIINIFKRASLLKKLYKQEQFDLVFAFLESAGYPSTLAYKDTIVSVRDNPSSLPKIYQPFLSRIYPRAKKVVACAKAIEEILIREHGLKNTITIQNAIDIQRAQQLSQETIDVHTPFILAAGRLAPQKGFDLLIDAYANSSSKKHVDLIILGKGQEREALQAQINSHGLSSKIQLKGSVDNPFAYYSKASTFVLSSRHEGFPNILIEALACACPAIAFDCPTGPNEIIEHNQNGLLVETENVQALTTAIDELHKDEQLQEKFRRNASQSVQRLEPQKIAAEWLKLKNN